MAPGNWTVAVTGIGTRVCEIGPYRDTPVCFQDYHPDAPAVARMVADAIMGAGNGLVVEHVGSTAVPDIGGKGIIDLMVLYRPGKLSQANRILNKLGFGRQTTRDPFPETRPMRVGAVVHKGRPFRNHAHVIAADATEVADLRTFRDRLRAEPEFRTAYEVCKQRILAAGITDSLACAEAKGECIRSSRFSYNS